MASAEQTARGAGPYGSRFVWRVFGGIVATLLVVAVLVEATVLPALRERMVEEIEARVRDLAQACAELAAPALREPAAERDLGPIRRASQRLPGARVTLVAADGTVVFDTHEDPERMEDHGGRPEIVGPGETVTRESRTLGRRMTYHAVSVERQGKRLGFARVALPADAVDARIAEVQRALLRGLLAALGVGLIAAWVVARRVTRPLGAAARLVEELGHGGVRRRLPAAGPREVGQLSAAVNAMADELEARLERIRQDQEEREAVLSSMAEGVVAVDGEGRVLYVNAAARELLGLGPEARGRPLVEGTRVPEVRETILRCLEEGGRIRAEARLEGPAGVRVIDLGAAPLGDPEGEVRGCVLVLHDLSELRRLETVRRDFVANVSHELKTPLTSLRGFLETVLSDDTLQEDTRRRFLQRALENADRLAAIVSDLLSLARLESGQGLLAFEPLELARVVEETVESARADAEQRGVDLGLELQRPLVVRGDRQALSMAVANLVDNAIKYSPHRSPVRVRVARRESRARIEVADRGPGIAPAEQERIFERFYRVDKNRSRQLGGTGLGLSIVRHVALAHGGSVSVESAPGRGSTFCIEVPLASPKS